METGKNKYPPSVQTQDIVVDGGTNNGFKDRKMSQELNQSRAQVMLDRSGAILYGYRYCLVNVKMHPTK